MANPTTNYGWVLPTPTDLVTDLPADFDVALQGVDTRLKALQPGTTLGDLAYSSATANTNTRLGVGTTGQVLTVTGGVPVWAAIPASAPRSGFNYTGAGQATSSTSYTDLATSQAVTVTTGTKVAVFMAMAAYRSPATANQGAYATYNISGATTYSGDNSNALQMQVMPGSAEQLRYSMVDFRTVTAGSNTFTMKFAVNPGNSVTFLQRLIAVIDLGS